MATLATLQPRVSCRMFGANDSKSSLSLIIPYTRSLDHLSPSPSAGLYFTPVCFNPPSPHLQYPPLVYVHIPFHPYPSTRTSHSIISISHSFIILQYPLSVPHRLDSYACPGACSYFSSLPPIPCRADILSSWCSYFDGFSTSCWQGPSGVVVVWTASQTWMINGWPEKLPDVRYSWWVLSSLVMIDRARWIDKDKLKRFLSLMSLVGVDDLQHCELLARSWAEVFMRLSMGLLMKGGQWWEMTVRISSSCCKLMETTLT